MTGRKGMKMNADPKYCSGCDTHKPRAEFGQHGSKKNGNAVRQHCRPCEAIIARKKRHKNPNAAKASVRRSRIKTQYGLTEAAYSAMLAAQNQCCAICKSTTPSGRHKNFNIDHCHKTGNVRGLLCTSCNLAIGMLKDDPDTVLAAAAYLENGGFVGVNS